MAEEFITRGRVHVSEVLRNILQESGLSSGGALQVALGHVVTSPDDRFLLSRILEEASQGQATGKRVHMPVRSRIYY